MAKVNLITNELEYKVSDKVIEQIADLIEVNNLVWNTIKLSTEYVVHLDTLFIYIQGEDKEHKIHRFRLEDYDY